MKVAAKHERLSSKLYFLIALCVFVLLIYVFQLDRRYINTFICIQRETDTTHLCKSTNASENSDKSTPVSLTNKSEFQNRVSGAVWHKTSLYQIFDKFQSRTLETCQNNCDNIILDLGCMAKTSDYYSRLISESKLSFVPLLSQHEYVFPYEKEYLSDPPLTDLNKLPDLNLSTVVLFGAVNNVVTCQVSDVITGYVQLVDGYGDERKVGGDEVRLWVVSMKDIKLRSAGHVTDLRNGSYRISFKCLWPGEMEVNIAVPYPREYLRLAILQSHQGITRYIAGKFKNTTVEEATICWSTPNIPGRPCVCNLTAVNYNHPFYCGRPLNPRLSCSDWVATIAMPVPAPSYQKGSQEEVTLIDNALGGARKHLIQHEIKVVVKKEGHLPNLPSCSEMSPNVTWDRSQWPTAYCSSENSWTSLICRAPELTPQWAIPCLSNTRVWIFGDSNAWRLFVAITRATNISMKGQWHQQKYVRNKRANITISFSQLEYPLFCGQNTWTRRFLVNGVTQQLDKIPSTGEHIVIIHYYMHVVPSHMSVLQLRLQILHEAIKRLLNRNPKVLIGLRGPHIAAKMWDINHAVGGDSLGTFFMEILSEVFKDLRHKVVFLDGWEMTIAIENTDIHPPEPVANQLIRTLLSFKCT